MGTKSMITYNNLEDKLGDREIYVLRHASATSLLCSDISILRSHARYLRLCWIWNTVFEKFYEVPRGLAIKEPLLHHWIR